MTPMVSANPGLPLGAPDVLNTIDVDLCQLLAQIRLDVRELPFYDDIQAHQLSRATPHTWDPTCYCEYYALAQHCPLHH